MRFPRDGGAGSGASSRDGDRLVSRSVGVGVDGSGAGRSLWRDAFRSFPCSLSRSGRTLSPMLSSAEKRSPVTTSSRALPDLSLQMVGSPPRTPLLPPPAPIKS